MSILKVTTLSKTYMPLSKKLKKLFNKEAVVLPSPKVIRAIENVSFDLNAGEIIGLLGPNGAGKSTLIKIIAGLISSDCGDVEICGFALSKNRELAIANLGAVIEIPEMNKNVSALDNLKYLARLQGGVSDERIFALAKLLGLDARLRDKVGTYSLGMKQRLGIIQAIMHQPKLLLLDEPTNGLDPQGIIDMRNLIKNLAKEQNMAVMVSSHNLAEIDLICDRIVILNKGKQIDDVEIENLKTQAYGGKNKVSITCDNTALAQEILLKSNHCVQIATNVITLFIDNDIVPQITKDLVLGGVNVYGVSVEKPDLESIFTQATSHPFDEINSTGGKHND